MEAYLEGLTPEKRREIEVVRRTILANLPAGYEERIKGSMIAYVVPHSILPQGYHCDPSMPLMYAGLTAQKNYNSLYLMGAYGDAATGAWFRGEHVKRGKKLDMGKACVRFKAASDLELDLIGEAIARIPVKAYVERYLAVQNRPRVSRKKIGA